ncbi:AP-1 complex subunit gamma NDAI_0A01350 [Naumovozyma dairenensis CBS 421]|uniref:AP-1 complex subunit gamma n=1 Tax=Naumovozyma dairenensis (strain ATCC 10597 / BCRC 20456 / CBS 421 / NBRC 0211 / NRRL Y-12639) TaxID=1071378 RepID=G0W3A5_NAUDC|nr:hypothetical protein NDAI_0A01350 [Naumovozyma dairenensis CBS 421]CCD22293.1 hypothetical protein NDAI_0A01350 [Naumovozyma dairenensis CBS 421]
MASSSTSSSKKAASSLKSFIKDVRGAKTLADERAIVTKQSAKVRTKLRDDHLSHSKRRTNIQKLLYLYILGEQTHFGQVECINLIASDDFVDKRLGYLSTSLLLDESEDLLTLLTNILSNDLNHPSNRYIVSLALNTLGSLTSIELARDLFPDVQKIIKHSKFNREPLIMKKCLQCLAKLITKDSSLLEILDLEVIEYCLDSNLFRMNHGVLLSISKLFQAILLSYDSISRNNDQYEIENYNTKVIPFISKYIPTLFEKLLGLMNDITPEFNVQGTADPFLQCDLIYTLTLFFNFPKEIDDISKHGDKFINVLIQVANNTSSTTGPGKVVLYETTRSIFSLKNFNETEMKPLYTLGINTLATFLKAKDNNTKYVALNSLVKVIPYDPESVQRHKKFILNCLNDHDISIKMRAIELLFAILNNGNLIELINEIMNFLENLYANQFKNFNDDWEKMIHLIIDSLIVAFKKFSIAEETGNPSDDSIWKLKILIKILKLVGNFIDMETINDILISFNNTENIDHKFQLISRMLLISLKPETLMDEIAENNIAWNIVSIWCLGEYSDSLLLNKNVAINHEVINEFTIASYLQKMDESYRIDKDVSAKTLIHYLLTSALKLSVKLNDKRCIENLRRLILNRTKDSDLMIQLKAVQYDILFNQPANVKKVLLSAMPIFENSSASPSIDTAATMEIKSGKTKKNDLLLDLLDYSTDELQEQKKEKPANLLQELLQPNTTNNNSSSTEQQQKPIITLPDDAKEIHSSENIEVYSKLISHEEGFFQMELYFKPLISINNLKTFCAVTKTQKLTLGQLFCSTTNNDTFPKHSIIRQSLKVTGTGKLKLRLKLTFESNDTGSELSEQFDHKFDQTL